MYITTGMTAITIFVLTIVLMNKMNVFIVLLASCCLGIFALVINVLILEEIIRRIHEKLLITATIINGMGS